ncbi:MAG TPA: nuclear transport factor 2 family protein [Candidatus Binataceae bacterium]
MKSTQRKSGISFAAAFAAAVTITIVLLLGVCVSAAETAGSGASGEIREATLLFYVALNSALNGDVAPMSEVWSHASDVTDFSPFGGRAVGWNQVYAQFQNEGRTNLARQVSPADMLVVVDGAMGYSVCNENSQVHTGPGVNTTLTYRATNVFRREDGKWKMVHHHADLSSPAQDTPPVHKPEARRAPAATKAPEPPPADEPSP